MTTVNFQDASGPGAGGSRPLFQRNPGRYAMVLGKIDFDSSYPTGGEDISTIFDQFKCETNQDNIYVFIKSKGGYIFTIDHTNKKVLAYQQSAATSALTEVPNTTNLSTITGVRFMAFGPLA